MDRLRLVVLFAACAAADAITLAWMLGCIVTGSSKRFERLAVAKDRCFNAVLNGNNLECVSSRAGRKWPSIARFINWIFADPDHCKDSLNNDILAYQSAIQSLR
jgi:hypothetical protein